MPWEEGSGGYLAEKMLSAPELCKGNRRRVERRSGVNLNPSLFLSLPSPPRPGTT